MKIGKEDHLCDVSKCILYEAQQKHTPPGGQGFQDRDALAGKYSQHLKTIKKTLQPESPAHVFGFCWLNLSLIDLIAL